MVEVRSIIKSQAGDSSHGTRYGSNLEIYQDIIGELKQKMEKIEEAHAREVDDGSWLPSFVTGAGNTS